MPSADFIERLREEPLVHADLKLITDYVIEQLQLLTQIAPQTLAQPYFDIILPINDTNFFELWVKNGDPFYILDMKEKSKDMAGVETILRQQQVLRLIHPDFAFDQESPVGIAGVKNLEPNGHGGSWWRELDLREEDDFAVMWFFGLLDFFGRAS